jgi:peptide/nickel transport system permease protein
LEARVGATLVVAIILMVLVSLVYTPHSVYDMVSGNRNLSPSLTHPLGTDSFGRDMLSRVMVGGRYTIAVALSTVFGSALIGSIIGLIIGYFTGAADAIVMRLMDALSAFPGILLALIFIAVLPPSAFTIVIALLILFVPSFTRIMRSSMLAWRNQDFVNTALVMGAGHLRVITRHILPNLLPVLLSALVIGLSNAILAEAALSFLGLGIQPPTPSWGRMLAEAQSNLFSAPWCALAPGALIILTVLGFYFLGEGIRKRYCG